VGGARRYCGLEEYTQGVGSLYQGFTVDSSVPAGGGRSSVERETRGAFYKALATMACSRANDCRVEQKSGKKCEKI
jgi:hypothetical protein